jgi:hypothetical protein
MPLRYVNPNEKRGRLYRANVRFGRSRAGQFIARHIARRTDPYLFRLTSMRRSSPPARSRVSRARFSSPTSTMDPTSSCSPPTTGEPNIRSGPTTSKRIRIASLAGNAFQPRRLLTQANTHGCTSWPSRSTPGMAIIALRQHPSVGRFRCSDSSRLASALPPSRYSLQRNSTTSPSGGRPNQLDGRMVT